MNATSSENLFRIRDEEKFYLWINPKNYIIFHNVHFTGLITSNPMLSEQSTKEDNLLFIPNPNYKNFITPYQNNIIKRIRAEYWLEFYRPPEYPSRLQALYIFNSECDAKQYKEFHPDHVKGRILISGSAINNYLYSIHDSGWFDYLCKDASIDNETIRYCATEYWKGTEVEHAQLTIYGHYWSQKPTLEVLYYGSLKITDKDKKKILREFKIAYETNPLDYPKMNLENI